MQIAEITPEIRLKSPGALPGLHQEDKDNYTTITATGIIALEFVTCGSVTTAVNSSAAVDLPDLGAYTW